MAGSLCSLGLHGRPQWIWVIDGLLGLWGIIVIRRVISGYLVIGRLLGACACGGHRGREYVCVRWRALTEPPWSLYARINVSSWLRIESKDVSCDGETCITVLEKSEAILDGEKRSIDARLYQRRIFAVTSELSTEMHQFYL